ncbi:hypothetical protein SLA2020_528750 [Shorea laevis]
MASAQVLPSSRKQEHLEAGKRRLEEFRKKKAAEKAKKAASISQPQNQLEVEHVQIIDVDGVGTSDGPSTSITNNKNSSKEIKFPHETQQVLSTDTNASPSVSVNGYRLSSAEFQTHANNIEIKKYNALGNGPLDINYSSGTKQMANDFETYVNDQDAAAYGHTSDHLIGVHQQASQDYESNYSQSSFPGIEESKSKEKDNSLTVSSAVSAISSQDFFTKFSFQNSQQSKPSNASLLGSDYAFSTLYEDSVQSTTSVGGFPLEVRKDMLDSTALTEPMISIPRERRIGSSASGFPSMQNTSAQTSEASGFSFDVRNSSSHMPPYPVTNDTSSRRSRPSFLDSLNASRAFSVSPFQRNEPQKDSFVFHTSQVSSTDVQGPSPLQKPLSETVTNYSKLGASNVPGANEQPMNSSFFANNDGDPLRLSVNENSMEKKHEFYSPQKNEDFAALEQHIEDLTLEKFSLQRALEASQVLAESLAAENSSLTDNYNQQRSIVNQLKSDMENLQEEIKAQLAELESLKMEYTNAQLECSAADERANILASEVIGLEEKALRLRSNELKLERQLENTQAEISSYKRKMSSLEKERQDLQSTIDALQEEKKVLQSKLRKASLGGKPIDISKSPASRKDVSTSTEDLDTDAISATSNEEMHNSSLLVGGGASGSTMVPENGELLFEALSVNIPPDQMRMIQNINALISELALEKEELTRALSSELSQSLKLKEFNKELSRKLEAQTQRLELLTAQSMASENISARQPDSHTMHENTTYADEGDEVVERVLGWIMKLFPGGPSRRRTSKLL